MGQHKFNPNVIAIANGALKRKATKPIKVGRTDLHDLQPQPRDVAAEAESREHEAHVRKQRSLFLRFRYRMRHAFTALLPPQSGHRRAEFSSPVKGEWSKA